MKSVPFKKFTHFSLLFITAVPQFCHPSCYHTKASFYLISVHTAEYKCFRIPILFLKSASLVKIEYNPHSKVKVFVNFKCIVLSVHSKYSFNFKYILKYILYGLRTQAKNKMDSFQN